VRQIAILVVGARFDAAYEIYAHIAVAEKEGMSPERLATLVADLKPVDLSSEEKRRLRFLLRAQCAAAPCPSRCTGWRSPRSASTAPTS
jgi:alkylhydroperoxidase family enzyme